MQKQENVQNFLPGDVHLFRHYFSAPSPQTTQQGLSGDSEDGKEQMFVRFQFSLKMEA